ncbi:MAG: hypothetical protein H8E36_02615 [Rhodospirillaceae bacterium]|nr:hypothetical protein [Rhodospirillaceae bacterium]MBL6931291.1 hypothetical protein [Rhodospirillales bacterium]MBL6941294.1 hypothetical protein [Rhodospirillales bacterium]
MKISARKVAPDVYALNFDDTEVVLEGKEIKMLLLEVMQTLAPGGSTKKEDTRSKDFMRRIKNANDVGIQKLLLVADHEDLLVLLKNGELDEMLQDKFFSNMSDKNRKMFEEDLVYQFKDGIPAQRAKQAIKRLIETAKDLEVEGSLTYENVMSR